MCEAACGLRCLQKWPDAQCSAQVDLDRVTWLLIKAEGTPDISDWYAQYTCTGMLGAPACAKLWPQRLNETLMEVD
jgi:hypothetical protein